jgi:hypothetical protein
MDDAPGAASITALREAVRVVQAIGRGTRLA